MLDPDTPGGIFTHWLAYGLPPAIPSLAAGPTGAAEGVNDFGRRGYGGPPGQRQRRTAVSSRTCHRESHVSLASVMSGVSTGS